MNQMTSALVAAGVKVPSQSRRIWSYLKDHPQLTSERIAQALSINKGSVSSLLAQMAKQNRVQSKMLLRSAPKGGMRKRAHWEAIGESYDNPPRRATPAVVPAEPVNKPGLREMLVERICTTKPSATQVVDTLTVAQARELWLVLNRMFGSVK